MILSGGSVLQVPLRYLGTPTACQNRKPTQTLAETEREHILATLNECDWILSGPNGAATSGHQSFYALIPHAKAGHRPPGRDVGWSLSTRRIRVQIGSQKMDIVAASMDKALRSKLLSDCFTVGSDASAAWVGEESAHAYPEGFFLG